MPSANAREIAWSQQKSPGTGHYHLFALHAAIWVGSMREVNIKGFFYAD